MAADSSRFDELRRRVHQDHPASIAFAQLAEEYPRRGDYREAVRVSRAGFTHHPFYLSARVTLGRALVALGHDSDAEIEFAHVLRAAPDHLFALRSLEELLERRRDLQTVYTDAADPGLQELERWFAAIVADRAERSGESTPRHPPY